MSPDRARLAARLAPLLFLVPVALGLALSLARLIGNGHPVYGWSMSINADAEAMYLGIWPFQDPADGYTGNAYTPLFPALVSLLHHLHLWTGWGLVVVILSAAGSAALIAAIAYRAPEPGESRLLALGEAAGLGALALSLVLGLSHPGLYEARADQLEWVLALGAIALVPRAARGGVGAKAAVVALLTAAFWAKQTGLVASVCVLAVVVLMVWSRRLGWRAAAAWMGVLVALNAALLGALTWATDGWQFRFNFGIHLPRTRSYLDVIPEFLERGAPAFAFLAIGVALAVRATGKAAAARPPLRARLERASDRELVVAGLVLLAVVGTVSGLSLRRYSGGDDNNLLPVLWAVGALGALAYRAAAAHARTAGAMAAAAAILAATTLAPGGDWRVRSGDLVPDHHFQELPREVEEFARTHLVWDPFLSDLNVASQGVIQPNMYHIQEALLRGGRPKHLERMLLGRRFDGVFRIMASLENLGSVRGLDWEDNYFWKLGQVVLGKYMPARSTPVMPGGNNYESDGSFRAWVPRPGPDPVPWLDGCFGPFALAGIELNIHVGGGLWCQGPAGTMTMRGTPASITELVSEDPVRTLEGTLDARLAAGLWRIERDDGWVLLAQRGGAGLRLGLQLAGSPIARRAVVRGAAVRLRFVTAPAAALAGRPGSDTIEVRLPRPSNRGLLHFWATQGSGAKFNLKGLRAE